MHRPWQTFAFVAAVALTLAIVAWLGNGRSWELAGGLALRMPQLPHANSDTSSEKVERLIEGFGKMDTTFDIVTSTSAVRTEPAPLIKSIQYTNASALSRFYKALGSLEQGQGTVRIMHFGDSQIEGDRITGYLRDKLQQSFGGEGLGLISLMPFTQRPLCKVTLQGPWEAHRIFTSVDKAVPHHDYGIRASFERFMPLSGTDSITHASFELTPSKGEVNAARYSRIRMFYGNARRRVWCSYHDGPALMSADSLQKGGLVNVREFEVAPGSEKQTVKFTGLDSPDFYALSLEGKPGILVDNIAMRGSSGTFFHQVNAGQMKSFMELLSPSLIILQFGGNTLPAIRDSAMAVNYAGYIRFQLTTLKKLAPGADILFVGPSDMSLKNGLAYETYPLLEPMRNALRSEVLKAGCAYYDLYDAMGGRNSMPVWVAEGLAGTDYIHFTPQGARQMATLLYGALMNDYHSTLSKK